MLGCPPPVTRNERLPVPRRTPGCRVFALQPPPRAVMLVHGSNAETAEGSMIRSRAYV
jgi:hypothetical protein